MPGQQQTYYGTNLDRSHRALVLRRQRHSAGGIGRPPRAVRRCRQPRRRVPFRVRRPPPPLRPACVCATSRPQLVPVGNPKMSTECIRNGVSDGLFSKIKTNYTAYSSRSFFSFTVVDIHCRIHSYGLTREAFSLQGFFTFPISTAISLRYICTNPENKFIVLIKILKSLKCKTVFYILFIFSRCHLVNGL